MATLQELERALVNADRAGDTDAARRLAAFIIEARKDSANQIPGAVVPSTIPQAPEPGVMDTLVGVGETALAAGTGAVGGLVGMPVGGLTGLAQQILNGQYGTPQAMQAVQEAAMKGSQALTYQPRTQSGQEMTQAVGQAFEVVPPIIPVVGPIGAVGQSLRASMPLAMATGRRVAAPAIQAAQTVAERAKQAMPTMGTPTENAGFGAGSIGAAQADLARQRVAASNTLPVPITLTKGAATRDPEILSFEKGEMTKADTGAPLRQRRELNNLQVLQNFDSFIDDIGPNAPDIPSTGRTVVDSLTADAAKAKRQIRVAYKEAEKAGEMESPVQLDPLIDFLNQSAPEAAVATIINVARNKAVQLGAAIDVDGVLMPTPVTLKNAELLRRSVGNVMGADPTNIKFGVDIKNLIDDATQTAGGDAYRKARALRTEYAQTFENRAIVADLLKNRRGMADPKVAIDQVFKRTILNGSPEELDFLKRVLRQGGEDGNQAWKDLQAATIKHLEEVSTSNNQLDSAGRRVVSSAALDKEIQRLDKNGRLDIVLGKQRAAQVRTLNEMLQYVITAPPGTLINTSGTTNTIIAALAEAGAIGAGTGIPLPVYAGIKAIREQIKDKKLRAKIQNTLIADR